MWKDEITKRSINPEQRYYNNMNKLDKMISDTEEFAKRMEESMKNSEKRYAIPLGRDSSHPIRTMEEVRSLLAKAGDLVFGLR